MRALLVTFCTVYYWVCYWTYFENCSVYYELSFWHHCIYSSININWRTWHSFFVMLHAKNY